MSLPELITTTIDWTLRSERADDGSQNQPNRGVQVLFLADLLGIQFVFPYDVAHDQLAAPVQVNVFFRDLPWDRIDAGVNWGNGKVYLFRNDQCACYDLTQKRVENPLPIAGNWKGMPFNHLDAVLNYGNGKIYFFSQEKYARYDMGRNSVDPDYPKDIQGFWPGVPWDRIRGAVNWGNGKVYFFHGAEYLRYDIQTDRAETAPELLTTLRMGTTGFSLNDFRVSVETIARSLVGSHYLWGSTGASPNGWEGNRVRPTAVHQISPQRTIFDNPAIFAAECNADPRHGHQVCGGRYTQIAGGGIIQQLGLLEQELLRTYLSGLALLTEKDWLPYGIELNLSPRVMLEIANQQAVLGEDCRAKRHFDCIGFVNYCVEMATARIHPLPISYSIEQWAANGQLSIHGQVLPNFTGCTDVPLTDPPTPADILIQDFHHIGLLGSDGTVIQAAETKSGVIISPYKPEQWSRRRRLQASLLHS